MALHFRQLLINTEISLASSFSICVGVAKLVPAGDPWSRALRGDGRVLFRPSPLSHRVAVLTGSFRDTFGDRLESMTPRACHRPQTPS